MTQNPESPALPSAAPRAILPACVRTAALLAAILALTTPAAFSAFGPTDRLERTAPGAAFAAPLRPEPVQVTSADRLSRLFDRLGYELDAVRAGELDVPLIELAALPADLDDMESIDRRKALFIRAILPVVLRANEAVLADRAILEGLLRDIEAGPPADRALADFRRIAARYIPAETAETPASDEGKGYEVEVVAAAAVAAPDADAVRRLLRRVDAVPVSLAIAQAISESGWGTSRFAQKGNALFGQWTWDPAAGIVPVERPTGRSHRVRSFRNLTDSAHAYLFNLNTHPAYEGFRAARAAARAAAGELPDGPALARHLTRYSERREAYVRDIVGLIRHNRLDRLDAAELGEPHRYADADPVAAGLIDG